MPFGREQFRHQSPRAKTAPPAQPAFRTHRPASRAAAPAALASGNARDDTADRTIHTAPGTIASPAESATGRPTHADVAAAADEADRPRRTQPTRRPPASLLADGEALQAPGSD